MAAPTIRKWAARFQGRTPILKASVGTGANANTNIAITGIHTDDVIVAAIEFTSGVPSIVPATVTSAGNIQSTSSTSGNTVLVLWYSGH